MPITLGDYLAHDKKRHYTKDQAKKLLKRLRAKGGKYKHKTIYRCPICLEWCLSSIAKKDRYDLDEINAQEKTSAT